MDRLKTALLNAYADKRDVFTLNIEMAEMKQSINESVFDFYNKIQHNLNLQIAYIITHSEDDSERTILSKYSQTLAVRVLLRGLKEPIGSLMRTKDPDDMSSALNMLTNDFQIESANQKSAFLKQKTPFKQNPFIRSNFQTRQNFNYNPPLQITNFSHNAQATQRPQLNPQPGPSKFYTNASRTEQPRNYPQPMSISTRNTYRSQNQSHYNYRTNNNKNNSNVIVEELHNVEQPTVEHPKEENVDLINFFSRTSLGKSKLPRFELMNCNHESNLPYIQYSEYGLKILIDTGSTKSFIRPV